MTTYITAPKLNPGQIAELRTRVAAGESRTALAREFGISRQSLYNVAGDVAAAHPSRYQSPPKLTPEQADELRRLAAAGERRWRLSQRFGICTSTVYTYLRRAGEVAHGTSA